MVVGDQGSFDRGADDPVVPDAGVEGEEPLDDAGSESCGDAAAMAFEAELAFQGPDDGLDALSEPVRERARLLLVFAGGADQGQSRCGSAFVARPEPGDVVGGCADGGVLRLEPGVLAEPGDVKSGT